ALPICTHLAPVQFGVGPARAALVRIVRIIDLDDVGAEHRELIGGERPRQHMRHVDDADSLERPHRCAPFVAESMPRFLPGLEWAANSVCSPPPCGEGVGAGVVKWPAGGGWWWGGVGGSVRRPAEGPPPRRASRVDPPHKGRVRPSVTPPPSA